MKTAAKKLEAYRSTSSRSKRLHDRAVNLMPGGNTRHSVAFMPYPVYAASATGCRITDVEGEERIDFISNYTSHILGHGNEQVLAAVREQLERCTALAMPCEDQLDLAELLIERVAYVDKVRFCNSGSEAVMLAIKAARAFTGKPKIAKFEGNYHGIYDYAQVSEGSTPENWGEARAPAAVVESGTAPGVLDDVIVLPWNDIDSCAHLLKTHAADLAGVLTDPLPLAEGLISPKPGFFESLAEVARDNKILFISDEVLGFRLGYNGAMVRYGVNPDITTLGKIIGGGFPVGAVCGSDDVMSVFDHNEGPKVHHGGTFNANPITMAAGLAQMRQVTPEALAHIDRLGELLREGVTRRLSERGIPVQAIGEGSLFAIHLTDVELVNYRSLAEARAGREPLFPALAHEMLMRGIAGSTRYLMGCISTPMTEREIEAYIDALDDSLQALNFKG